MPGRTYSREFKFEIVRQIESGERRIAQICREQQIADSLIQRWRKQYRQQGEEAFTPGVRMEADALERKVAELERFCGQFAAVSAQTAFCPHHGLRPWLPPLSEPDQGVGDRSP
jgi:putative transposase